MPSLRIFLDLKMARAHKFMMIHIFITCYEREKVWQHLLGARAKRGFFTARAELCKGMAQDLIRFAITVTAVG